MRNRETFKSPYDQYRERNGEGFTLLGEADPRHYDRDEVGPIYRIRFADGEEIEAWPEEIFEGYED